VVAAGGIVLSFPLGVVLALARRSSFPLIRPIAVLYIELIRGVPLITLLFMGRFAMGFFVPAGTTLPGVIPRAIIMITLFTAAYVAEVVRGGLQSVPRGQTEGAQALGLSPLKTTRLIVLPQALRNSIPALIGQFISLLKDTSLLVVIGVQEILGVTEPVLAQLQFKAQGYQPEAYAFVCLMFWVICFSMSRASQRLETRLGVGKR
jgi:general L-amino acid transport system permease protein